MRAKHVGTALVKWLLREDRMRGVLRKASQRLSNETQRWCGKSLTQADQRRLERHLDALTRLYRKFGHCIPAEYTPERVWKFYSSQGKR